MKLTVKFDTRPFEGKFMDMAIPGVDGNQISEMIHQTYQRALKEGYQEWEFEWWDFCEGWVSCSGNVAPLEIVGE